MGVSGAWEAQRQRQRRRLVPLACRLSDIVAEQRPAVRALRRPKPRSLAGGGSGAASAHSGTLRQTASALVAAARPDRVRRHAREHPERGAPRAIRRAASALAIDTRSSVRQCWRRCRRAGNATATGFRHPRHYRGHSIARVRARPRIVGRVNAAGRARQTVRARHSRRYARPRDVVRWQARGTGSGGCLRPAGGFIGAPELRCHHPARRHAQRTVRATSAGSSWARVDAADIARDH